MAILLHYRFGGPSRSGICSGTVKGLLAALILIGCSGGAELLLPGDGGPAKITLVGEPQSGRVGETLADPLVFVVTDSRDRPVEGATIVFDLTSSPPGMDVVPDTAATDANGRAEVRLVLGTTVGPQAGEARVMVPEGFAVPTVTFTANALPENANGIAAVSGGDQTAAAGSVLSKPLVVQVTDGFGNPVSGVPISWTAEGGGSVSEASSVTDDEGLASVQRTLGPTAGPQSTVASSPVELAGSPVTFVHTATPGNASSLSPVSGDDQTAQAGTRLPADLVVRLVDAIGNGIPGAAVTWVVSTGGGSVTPQNGTTDEAGYSSAEWTLGPNPGVNRLDAVVSGVGVVTFQATGVGGTPPSLALIIQPSSSARNGQPLARQPVVQVRDNLGNSVASPGITITAQLSGGGGELVGTRQRPTDGSGRATFTDLAISGAEGNRILVFTASGYAGASSDPITVSAIGTNTTITSDSPDPSAVGQAVVVGFTVTAERVTPAGSVTVTDGSSSCTGTLSGGAGTCSLTLGTSGNRTLQATYSGAAGLNPSSDTESHQVNPPPPQNRGPEADYDWDCEGLTCEFTDRSEDDDGRVVAWSWNFGDGTPASTSQNPTHTYAGPGTYTVTLTATDDDGASDVSSATVEVRAPPPPPPGGTTTTITEDAPDPSAPGQLITVRFTVTSSSGTPTGIVNVTDQRGGGCQGAAPTGSCTYTPAGTGTRRITAVYEGNSSFRGSSGAAEHTVTEPANQPPTAAFTASCTNLNCSFNSGASNDPDGRITGYMWSFGDGDSSNSPNPQHTYQSGNTYTVTLTVTDDRGGTGSETQQVTVAPPPNQSPVAAFTWDCDDLECDFDNGSNDPDGSIQASSWSFGDGATSSEFDPDHTYTGGGTYTVTLTVTDDDGTSSSVSHQVSVTAPNQPPTAAFTPPTGCTAGVPCQFTDQSSDGDGQVVAWDWDFDDGGAARSNAQNPSYTFGESDTYEVRLRVTDDDGAQSEVRHNVLVGPAPNEAPTAVIGSISCNAMDCSFTDASTDPNGSDTIRQWSWAFGDGHSSGDRNAFHLYEVPGAYTVILTVMDEGSLTDDAQQNISVQGSSGGDGADDDGDLIAEGRRDLSFR